MAFLLAFGAALGITLLIELIRHVRHRLSPTEVAVEAAVDEAAEVARRIARRVTRRFRSAVTNLAELSAADIATTRPIVAVPLGSCEQHGAAPARSVPTRSSLRRWLHGWPSAARTSSSLRPWASRRAASTPASPARSRSVRQRRPPCSSSSPARPTGRPASCIVNGHGGNADAVEAATATIRAEGRNVLAWSPRVPDGDAHAGHTETSLMLAIDAATRRHATWPGPGTRARCRTSPASCAVTASAPSARPVCSATPRVPHWRPAATCSRC